MALTSRGWRRYAEERVIRNARARRRHRQRGPLVGVERRRRRGARGEGKVAEEPRRTRREVDARDPHERPAAARSTRWKHRAHVWRRRVFEDDGVIRILPSFKGDSNCSERPVEGTLRIRVLHLEA